MNPGERPSREKYPTYRHPGTVIDVIAFDIVTLSGWTAV